MSLMCDCPCLHNKPDNEIQIVSFKISVYLSFFLFIFKNNNPEELLEVAHSLHTAAICEVMLYDVAKVSGLRSVAGFKLDDLVKLKQKKSQCRL